MSKIQLNKGQELAVKRAVMWYNFESQLYFRLGGFAGTGKTFIIHHIINELNLNNDEVAFCSFTGNATFNMIQKGNKNAKTIHRLIYETTVEKKPIKKMVKEKFNYREIKEFEYRTAVNLQQQEFPFVYADEITGKFYEWVADSNSKDISLTKTQEYMKVVRYEKVCKTELIPCLDEKIKLIVLDEFSMPGDKLINDLLSFGRKILMVGDCGQLPPVKDENSYISQYESELTEIVRQAKGNPIIQLSYLARKKIAIPYDEYSVDEENLIAVQPKYIFDNKMENFIKWADQIIVGKNATRHHINDVARKCLGFSGLLPQKGEKIVCTKNNWNIEAYSPLLGTFVPLVNGSRGYVKNFIEVDMRNKTFTIDFQVDFDPGCIFRGLTVSFMNFDKSILMAEENEFDFAYAITCHKTQGNQYGKVVLLGECMSYKGKGQIDIEYEKKWLYTGITRAQKELVVFLDRNYYLSKDYKKSDEYYNSIEEYY